MLSKRKLVMPSDEEDAAIKAGIATDPNTREFTQEEFKQLQPMRGRPAGSGKKVQMTVRFDTDVIEAFKRAGEGWQTRMNDAPKDWLKTHQV